MAVDLPHHRTARAEPCSSSSCRSAQQTEPQGRLRIRSMSFWALSSRTGTDREGQPVRQAIRGRPFFAPSRLRRHANGCRRSSGFRRRRRLQACLPSQDKRGVPRLSWVFWLWLSGFGGQHTAFRPGGQPGFEDRYSIPLSYGRVAAPSQHEAPARWKPRRRAPNLQWPAGR